jgi:hypothetical protein
LRSDRQILVVGDFGNIPSREAVWITIALALGRILGAVEISMEVHLLARVVLMDILAIPGDLVCRVLYAVDAASDRVLSNANRISQPPTEAKAGCVELVCLTSHFGEIESSDLAMT